MLQGRKRNRLEFYDYSTENLYFVTSCVLGGEHWLGEVVNGEMQLNSFGKIAEEHFSWLANQCSFLEIHAYVVMPNHVHAILELTGSESGKAPLSVSQVMAAYKTLTSKKIRLAGLPEFAWKRSFHDHIIRNERGYWNIFNYIRNNPAQWQQDKFNKV